MPKLKDKRREEFCQQYVIDFNATRAAKDSGYSKKTAYAQGPMLLKRLDIQKRIKFLMSNRSERTKITQDMVLQELAVLGFSDFRDYAIIDENGDLTIQPFDLIKRQNTRAIESIKQTKTKDGGSLSMKLHGKVRPLELLGKHLGMFADTHNVNLTGDIQVISAIPRPKKENSE